MRDCRGPSHSGWKSGAGAHDRIAVAQPRPTCRFNCAGSSEGPVAVELYDVACPQARALRGISVVKIDVVVWIVGAVEIGNGGDMTVKGAPSPRLTSLKQAEGTNFCS